MTTVPPHWLDESTRLLREYAAGLNWPTADLPAEIQFWRLASGLHAIEASILIAAGLVCLLYGWRVFRILVIVNAVVLGVWLGQVLAARGLLPWWSMLISGPLLGLLAWPLMRFAVAVCGALMGAFLGVLLCRSAALPYETAGAIVGFFLLGLLAFVIFRLIVIAFTSLQGAAMVVAGIVALAGRIEPLAGPLRDALTGRPYALLVLILVPAAVGFLYQLTREERPATAA